MYIGEFEYDGEIYRAEHDSIIDRETFDKVQKLLPGENYNRPRPSAQKYKYLLAGMIRCHCGNVMTPYSANSKGKRYHYYKCTDPKCKNAVSAPAIDDAVMDKIKNTIRDRNTLRELFDEYAEEAEQKEKSILDAFSRGMVMPENMPRLNSLLQEIGAEIESLKKRMDDFDILTPPAPPDSFFDRFADTLSDWSDTLERTAADPDPSFRQNVLCSILSHVICTSKNKFTISLFLSKCIGWWALRDSNPRHSRCKRDALTN